MVLFFKLSHDMFNIKAIQKQSDNVENFIPNTIEPSIGIDRLIYSVLYQNYMHRPTDDRRYILTLPKNINIFDIAIFPLHKKKSMINIVDKLCGELATLRKYKIYRDNTSTTIGKKYVRADELGIKYCITIDPSSVINQTCTIRDAETMDQIIIAINDIKSYNFDQL